MAGFDLFDISARISKELTIWNPPYNKVKKVNSRRIYDIARTTVPMNSTKFWEDDSKHKIVSKEDKERFFLRYHRSTDNYGNVYAFAHAMKNLCDNGIPIFHQFAKVVDFIILTNPSFEVGDVCWDSSLLLTDQISGNCVSSLPTYENLEILRSFPAGVCKRLGIIPPKEDQGKRRPKMASPFVHSRAMPHLWIAAILEEDRVHQGKVRSMVHIDVCAATYDDQGYIDYNGSLVSLKMFETPEYEITATSNLGRAIKYKAFDDPKLLLLPLVRPANGLWQFRMLNILPKSLRHFWCFEQMDSSHIEVTPLDFFVDQGCHFDITEMDKWEAFVNELRLEIICSIPRGASAVLHGYEQNPELNGKPCLIKDTLTNITTSSKKKLVSVSMLGQERRISVSVYSLGITNKILYTTLDSFARMAETNRWIFSTPEDERMEITKKIMEEVKKAIVEEPAVSSIINMMIVGKPSILTYETKVFQNGLKMFLERPICYILSNPMTQYIRNILEVLNCRRAEEALNILKIIRTGKQKLLKTKPQALLKDGSVINGKGAGFHYLMKRVQKKIMSDAELKYVFDLMGQHNIFPALPWH